MKITIRLSKPNSIIQELLKSDHGLIGPIMDWGNILGSVLYSGIVYGNQPSWSGFINSGLAENISNLYNQGATAIIFIPIDDRYMVLSFGYANSVLSHIGYERDFGLKVVLNSIDPTKVKSIDSKHIGNVVINKRTQLSKDKRIEDFGFEINKDFLKHIAGKPTSESFATMISGSDSLSINCDILVSDLFEKVSEIYVAYSSLDYKTNYSWVDNVKNVKDKTLLSILSNELVIALNSLLSGNPNDIYLACPSILDYDLVDHFRVRGYRSSTDFNFIDIDNLIIDLLEKGISSTTEIKLNQYYIESFDSNSNTINRWPILDWLIYEYNYNGVQYIYTEGEWFEISDNYFNFINTSFNDILNTPSEFLALSSTKSTTEESYINSYTFDDINEHKFDRNLSYVYGPQNSIEICDIYNSNREFIHIKEGGSSSKLSHLFNQGFVSASAFLNDSKFRVDVSTKLQPNNLLSDTISNYTRPSEFTIVYRILKNGATLTLPFFSKITLNEVYEKLKNMGYNFRLEWVQKIK